MLPPRDAVASSPAASKGRQQHDVEAAAAGGGEAGALVGLAAGGWDTAREVVEEPPPRFWKSSLSDTTVNLTNAILGAGMLALPHAFAGLGVLGGGELRPRRRCIHLRCQQQQACAQQ